MTEHAARCETCRETTPHRRLLLPFAYRDGRLAPAHALLMAGTLLALLFSDTAGSSALAVVLTVMAVVLATWYPATRIPRCLRCEHRAVRRARRSMLPGWRETLLL